MMGLLDYIKANTPRNTRKPVSVSKVINEGLLNPNQYNAPAANRLKDSAFGLLGLVPGAGDVAAGAEAADLWNRGEKLGAGLSALGTLPLIPAIGAHVVYHGSPHKFNKFDMSKIGTGEGAQAYGHGLYFAESPDVAKSYLKAGGGGKQLTVTLPNNQSLYGDQITDKGLEAIKYLERGAQDAGQFKHNTAYYAKRYTQDPDVQKLIDEWKDAKVGYKDHSTFYKVDIPDEAIPRMLDWDKPLAKQHPDVQKAMSQFGFDAADNGYDDLVRNSEEQAKAAWDRYSKTFADDDYKAFLMADEAQRKAWNGRASQMTGEKALRSLDMTDAEVSAKLRELGIPGIRYLDGTSRTAGDGTSNFVLFDDELARILEINGQPTGLLPWAEEAARKKK